MNTFANTLFTMLFGWARGLIQQVWSAAASGRLSGFFTWLGDHWLWVALFLCAACTVVDFLVWLVRWQPYLVWRTKLRSVRRFFRGEHRRRRRFERGYRDAAVPPELAPAPASAPAPDLWSEAEWASPAPQAAENAYPAPPMETIPENGYFQQPGGQDAPRQRMFVPSDQYELPPVDAPQRLENLYASDLPAARRRRRSDKYDKKRGVWQQRLAQITRDDEGLLDGLPPAVDREAAFHEPVYPNQPKVTPAPYAPMNGRQQGGWGSGENV